MKILIVSVYFPPQNAVASLRPYSWAKYWSRMGHNVTVLTTIKRNESNNTNFDCSDFSVIETPVHFPFRKMNSEVKQAAENKDDVNSKKSFRIAVLTKLKKGYMAFMEKSGCFATVRFPDWHDGWIKDAVKHLSSMDYDLLVTTAGPYSVHRAGLYLIKHGWKGKWICDWRDLFTKHHMYHGFPLFWPYEKYLENKFHKNATLITTVSEGMSATLQKITKTPVKTIYNGFDEEYLSSLFKKERKQNKKLVISYLGTVYKDYQDPSAFFDALGQLDKEGLVSPSDIMIQFAGNHTANCMDLVCKYGIEKYFKYLGFLTFDKSIQLQYDSDAVIFLEFGNSKVKGDLSGKLFEYMYIARKILIIGSELINSAGELAEKCNTGIFLGKNVEKIKEYILKEVKIKKKGLREKKFKKDMNEINKYSRRLQAEKMLDLLNV